MHFRKYFEIEPKILADGLGVRNEGERNQEQLLGSLGDDSPIKWHRQNREGEVQENKKIKRSAS